MQASRNASQEGGTYMTDEFTQPDDVMAQATELSDEQ